MAPQSAVPYLRAAAEAAAGAVMALYHREMTGVEQQVDVSIRAAIAQAIYRLTTSVSLPKYRYGIMLV